MSDLARPRAPRYESLDIWRGVACLMVLLCHSIFAEPGAPKAAGVIARLGDGVTLFVSWLWIGVPVFFVISGYCISATVDSHRRKATTIPQYFVRRFRRIYPPYWVLLVGTAIVFGALDIALGGALVNTGFYSRPWWHSAWQWIGSLTLTEQWRWLFVGGPRWVILSGAWTLCYEEQFYALTGALLLFCPTRYFLGAAAITVAVVIAALAAASAHVPINGLFLDGGWIQFALGVLLYYAVNYATRAGQIAAGVTFALVVLVAIPFSAALAGAPVIGPPPQNMASATPYVVASAFSLIALVLHPLDARMAALRVLAPLKTCGIMCYSLYLVHPIVIGLLRIGLEIAGVRTVALSPFLTIPVCAALAIWVSWRFHLAVETRFMTAPAARLVLEPATGVTRA